MEIFASGGVLFFSKVAGLYFGLDFFLWGPLLIWLGFILFVTFSGFTPNAPRGGEPDSDTTTTYIIEVFVMTRKSKLYFMFHENHSLFQ